MAVVLGTGVARAGNPYHFVVVKIDAGEEKAKK